MNKFTVDAAKPDETREGGISARDILGDGRRTPPSTEDEIFKEQCSDNDLIQAVELYEEGQLSASDAADMLGLSLREFVEIIVVDETWFSAHGIEDEAGRERLLNAVTDLIERENSGLSIRAFVEEYVLDEHFYAAVGARDEGARLEAVSKALSCVKTDSLGETLRRALSVGYSPGEYVCEHVLNEGWFSALRIDDKKARSAFVNRAVKELTNLEEFVFNAQWFTALAPRDRKIPDGMVEELTELIARREIGLVTEMLAKWDDRKVLLSPRAKNAALLLSCYAQWIDFDSSYLYRVKELLSQFRSIPRKSLLPRESAHVDTAEGLVRLHGENYDEAIVYFSYALKAAAEIPDDDLSAVNKYYLARCYWKKGLYEDALKYAQDAITHEDELNRRKRVAAIRMVEGWLCFLLGRFDDAGRVLGKAEKELEQSDDYVNHGNVLSFYGRLAMKEEKYDAALGHFSDAITAYQKRDTKHRNVARTHTNMAVASYLKARRVPPTRAHRGELLRLRREAFEHLNSAEYIYTQDRQKLHRGLGKVHYLRALLYRSSGETDEARKEVLKAYFLGEAKGDHILMGRAKRIQATITNDPTVSLLLSEEALIHAEQTGNRTLKARACLNKASILLKLSDVKEGKKWLDEADKCLRDEERRKRYWRRAFTQARRAFKTGRRGKRRECAGL